MKTLIACVIALILVSVAWGKGPITVYLAGDSTMAQKQPDKRPETGWGEFLQGYFDPAKVKIDNRAMNGRSTKTFISENRWQGIIDQLKKGDFVFIQFGHNDEGKSKVERYTPPDEFRANLVRMVNDVRAKHAIPVLLTPVMRRSFDAQGVFKDSHDPQYPAAFRAVAAELKVPLIDMQRRTETVIKQYGPEDSRKLFLQLKAGENVNYPKGIEDNTHFSPLGAELMAAQAVQGIKQAKLGLAKYVKKN
jgi:lysophospholipase L1-like esterase